MRLLSAESETALSPQTLAIRSSLLTRRSRLFDEKKQQIEHLGLHGYPNPVAGQLAKLTVKFMIFKAKSQADPPRLLKQKSAISQAKDNHPQKSLPAQYGILQR